MRLIHIVTIIIVAIFIGLSTHIAHAQERYNREYIHSYDVNIRVEESGEILVTENILYDFGSNSKHGIYRIIPYTKTNDDGKKYKMLISDIQVTNDQGTPYNWSMTDENNEIKIKIGDADRFLTGSHIYIIQYKVAGTLTYFSDHDELYWNVTGNEWEVSMNSITSRVILPEKVDSNIETICYKGYSGSKNQCDEAVAGRTSFFAQKYLLPREGLTTVVTFPKGIVKVLEPTLVVSFFQTIIGKIVSAVILLLIISWYILYPLYLPFKWYREGKDPTLKNSGPVTASFDPPKIDGRKLSPAETGALIDEDVNIRELAATIVHLAQRGHFRIIEKKKKDFELVRAGKHPEGDRLLPFEIHLMNGLFVSGATVVLKDAKLVSTMESVETSIYQQLISNKYFPHNPKELRKIYAVVTGLALMTFNILLAISAGLFGRIMPRKTLSGKEAANRAKSLKSFLESQKRQLGFQADKQMMFEKLLPYAIAYGVEKIWAERFKDLSLTDNEWYQSSSKDALTARLLTNSLHYSFASSFKSASSPPTHTSSSFGFSSGMSGGSSGGGGGGGGGGSW